MVSEEQVYKYQVIQNAQLVINFSTRSEFCQHQRHVGLGKTQ